MFARAQRPHVWVSASLIYVTTLSAIMAAEAEQTGLLVVVFVGLSFLVGFVLKRFAALLLPLSVIVITLIWFPSVDEAPLAGMVVGLVAGVLLGRMYEGMSAGEAL